MFSKFYIRAQVYDLQKSVMIQFKEGSLFSTNEGYSMAHCIYMDTERGMF